MLEFDEFCPPSFGALALHWVCTNYAKFAKRNGQNPALNPVFGVFAISILGSAESRSKVTQRQSLETIAASTHEWRHDVPGMMTAWQGPYWAAVAWGCAAGLLKLDGVGLCAGTTNPPTDSFNQQELRSQGMGLGWSLAKYPDDNARWRAINTNKLTLEESI